MGGEWGSGGGRVGGVRERGSRVGVGREVEWGEWSGGGVAQKHVVIQCG